VRAVIALPISQPTSVKYPCEPGWPSSFGSDAKVLSRQVAKFGNQSYLKADLKHLKLPQGGVQFIEGANLIRAVIITKRGSASLLLACFEVDDLEQVNYLRRIGLQENSSRYLSKLGLQLDPERSVYGLAISESLGTLATSQDGLLVVPKATNHFLFDVLYIQTLSAIAFEREILERATEATFKPGPLNLRARNMHERIRHWLPYPSSDSTRIYGEINLLRNSLMLDERREQIQSSLEQHTKRLNYSATVFVATLGILLSAFALAPVNDGVSVANFPTFLLIGASSLITSSITWFLSRN